MEEESSKNRLIANIGNVLLVAVVCPALPQGTKINKVL